MIYARHLNSKRRKLLQKYENQTGFEPLGQDDLDTGRLTFREVWSMNLDFLADLHADMTNLDTRGA